ncbi:MAG: PAS domain-containing sensor histidine kinase, partial [Methylocella sp.]
MTQPAVPCLAQREIRVRRAVPAMAALFAGALVAITVVIMREAYDRTVTDAFTDIELTAAVVTGNLNGTFRDSLNTDPAAALAQAAPSRALVRGQQLVVTGAAGDIVAAAPPLSGQNATLTDYLGPSQPLTIFAEKA